MSGPRLSLDTHHHNRDVMGLKYVYPVVSRRAGGVSVGINLNPNNACNWRCLYCQVPGLRRGGPPPIDLARLESELRTMLAALVQGDFMQTAVPASMRRFSDIALSGNGEPTSAPEFPQVVALIGRCLAEFDLKGRVKLVLISNGSLMHRAYVQAGLAILKQLGGEVWFKLDRATAAGMRAINGTQTTPAQVLRRLKICAGLCPTWLQTCVFSLDGQPPPEEEIAAYLAFLGAAGTAGIPLQGVLLYGLARAPAQPEAPRLGNLPVAWLDALADRIRTSGLAVRIHP